jgi:hypothetical protein
VGRLWVLWMVLGAGAVGATAMWVWSALSTKAPPSGSSTPEPVKPRDPPKDEKAPLTNTAHPPEDKTTKTQAPAPPTPQPRAAIDVSRFSVDNVSLVYNDELLSDESRARLIQIVADATPPDSWRRVETQPEDLTEERVILRNFGIKEEDDPESYKTIEALICQQNPGQFSPYTPGTKLRIPPIPVHAATHKQRGPVRVQTQNSAIIEQKSLSPSASIQASTVAGTTKLNTAATSAAANAVTQIDLLDPHHLISDALKSRVLALPPKVHAISGGGGIAIMRQRAVANTQCIDKPSQWTTTSPYWGDVHQSMAHATATPALRQALLEAARKTPLVILDWDDGTNVHGSEVEATALYTLHEFGLDFLAPGVDFVELNPKEPAQKERLHRILDDFALHYFCPNLTFGCTKEKNEDVDKANLLTDARSWIANPDSPSLGNEFVRISNQQNTDASASTSDFAIHDLVLWALMWNYFRADRDASNIVNMSFEVLSASFAIENPNYLDASHGLGIMAATDSRAEEVIRDIPQAAARDYLKFINVTSSDGSSIRGVSGPVPVSIIAPDCGFEYKSSAQPPAAIVPSTRGTSFASPYIAALAWIDTLLNHVDLNEIRHSLIQAGRLSREAVSPRVESAGPIDPARFLTPRTAYVIEQDNIVRRIHSAHLFLRDTKNNNTLNFGNSQSDSSPTKDVTIAILGSGAQQTARIRSIVPPEPDNPGTNPAAHTVDYVIASDWLFTAEDDAGHAIKCGGKLPNPMECREIGF